MSTAEHVAAESRGRRSPGGIDLRDDRTLDQLGNLLLSPDRENVVLANNSWLTSGCFKAFSLPRPRTMQ